MRSAHLLAGPAARRRLVGGLLLAAVVCGVVLPHPIRAQEVHLTLQERSDRGREVLPEGTEVLVLREEGSRAQTLEELGIDRKDLRSRLLARAKNEPGTLLDTLGANGKTKKLYTTRALLYLLARTPRGTLYESQVWRGAGFDLVVSGNQIMAPVPDGDLQGVFEKVINVATKTRLTLVRNGGRPLPKNTEVRIWAQDGKQSQAVQDRSFLKEKTVYKGKLGDGGKMEKQFERTWHSDSLLYVAARTPAGAFYETVRGGNAAFQRVETGEMTVAPAGSSGRDAVRTAFASSSWIRPVGLEDWAGWFTLLLFGIILGLAVARWWYESKISRVRRKQNELKAELKKKDRENNRSNMPLPLRPNSSDAETGEEETVEKMRTKNDELRQEIEELKEKVRKRDEKLRELTQSRSTSAEKEERGSKSYEKLQDEVEHWRSRAQSLASKHERDRQRIDELESRLDEAKTDSQSDSGPASPGPQAPEDDPAARGPASGPVGEHFVEWCKRDGAMTGRYYMFERALHEEDVDAAVTPIYYDTATEDRFRLDRDVSSHEFWMVEADADLLLLPAPKSDGTFRALAPAYETEEAAPSAADLQSIAPARIESVESGYRLHKKGVLNPGFGASPLES